MVRVGKITEMKISEYMSGNAYITRMPSSSHEDAESIIPWGEQCGNLVATKDRHITFASCPFYAEILDKEDGVGGLIHRCGFCHHNGEYITPDALHGMNKKCGINCG